MSIRAPTAIVGVSGFVSRLCRARRYLALTYLGADRSRRRAYGGFDVARRDRDETWRLRIPARGDEFLSARLSNVADVDRSSLRYWVRLCRSRPVWSGGAYICYWL